MKGVTENLLLLFICLSANLSFGQTTDTSFAGPYFLKREAYFKALPVRKNAIVFLGNSITEVGEWSELFATKSIINRGISGDVTYGVINRLPAILAQKPKKIFLAIGVNDIKRGATTEELAMNYERIIKLIIQKSPKTILYVQSILPVNEDMLAAIYAKITNERINKANHEIEKLAQKYGCIYVDLHQSLLKDKDGQLEKQLSTDGLHLQPTAYTVWANFLKSFKYIR
ncbi:arylesterase [Pedobacter glucosidilyticus]|nr:GDSL-type esterase/lipase family protein [Pedobacter glucosidilyticus]KHJ39368.1 arylesterase [Pedobacter glucosidilyticus]